MSRNGLLQSFRGGLCGLLVGVCGVSALGALPAVRVEGNALVAGGEVLRLRGINWGWWHLSATKYTESDMRHQAEWGANVARLAFSYGDLEDEENPGTWREDGFRELDEVVQWAEKYDQYVILDMHVVPGGQSPAAYTDGGRNRLWHEEGYQERWMNLWREIARRYKDRPNVAAYELLHEPVSQRSEPDTLVELCRKAIQRIREMDPDKVIVMSGDQWSNARDLKDSIKMDDPNVLYTFHFYEGGDAEAWLRNVHDVKGEEGTKDWSYFEVEVPVTGEVRSMSVLLRSNRNEGTTWFDDIKVMDGAGNVLQEHHFDKAAAPFWMERGANDLGQYDPEVGHDKAGALRVSQTTAAAYSGWTSPRWRVWPGQTYRITGWMKMEKATGGSFCAAALFGVNSAEINRADLRARIEPAVVFGKKYNVPLWVGEFAAARDAGPDGYQVASVEARIALFEELGLHWTYWNYRESTGPTTMALWAQKRDGTGDYPINRPLLALLKEAWSLNRKPLPEGVPFRHTLREIEGAPEGAFPFALEWDAEAVEGALDVSFLNTKPAGAKGRIVVRDGHFVESDSGKRVRFVGVNGMAFPTHDEADKMAVHLARSGVNLVRLHNMDNKGNWGPLATVFDFRRDDTQHYQAEVIDNFHYAVAALKKQGIYVTFEVQVNRQLKAGDGVGENPLLGKAMKRHDRYSRIWIDRMKKYARDLLTAVNPYTGLALKDDPVLATVEINNENTLYQTTYGVPAPEGVCEPYRSELQALWNAWLKERYADEETMLRAWNRGAGLGQNLISETAVWAREYRDRTKVAVYPIPADLTALPREVRPAVETEMRATDDVWFEVASSKGATPWHGQAHMLDLTFEDGKTYTISFRMRSSIDRSANIRICNQLPNWEKYGLDRDFSVTPEWKEYAFTFKAHRPNPGKTRLSFILGGETAGFYLRDLAIREGYPEETLSEGQSLQAGTLLSGFGTPERNLDWQRFLADTDRAFSEEMRSFLVDELGIQAPICDTQISYGKLEGPYREQSMDYADAHGYWQHPEFPGRLWDQGHWIIPNKAEVDDLLRNDEHGLNDTTLQALTLQRIAGKPYIISEFDHSSPTDYTSEMLPVMATYGSFQDWDGFDLFSLGNVGPYDSTRMTGPGWFEVLGHPGKFAFLQQAALIFRTGVFDPAAEQKVLTIPRDYWLDDNLKFSDAWQRAGEGSVPNMLQTRIAVANDFSEIGSQPSLTQSVRETAPNSSLHVAPSETGKGTIYRAWSPACAVMVGHLEDVTTQAGALTLQGVETEGGFLSVSLVSMDAEPIASSPALLMTLAGRIENAGMKWNQERNSVGLNWGNGPTIAAGMKARVQLDVDGPRTVYTLSSLGTRREKIDAAYENGKLVFSIQPDQKTLWYQIVK